MQVNYRSWLSMQKQSGKGATLLGTPYERRPIDSILDVEKVWQSSVSE